MLAVVLGQSLRIGHNVNAVEGAGHLRRICTKFRTKLNSIRPNLQSLSHCNLQQLQVALPGTNFPISATKWTQDGKVWDATATVCCMNVCIYCGGVCVWAHSMVLPLASVKKKIKCNTCWRHKNASQVDFDKVTRTMWTALGSCTDFLPSSMPLSGGTHYSLLFGFFRNW